MVRPLRTAAFAVVVMTATAACTGANRKPSAGVPTAAASMPTTFIDPSNGTVLAVVLSAGPDRGRFTVQFTDVGAFSGVLQLGSEQAGKVAVNGTVDVTAVKATAVGATRARLTVNGNLEPATLDSLIHLHLDAPQLDITFDTTNVDLGAARATADRVIAAFGSADVSTIAQNIAPDILAGRAPAQVAASLAAAKVTGVHVVASGTGRLTKLTSGYTAWVEPITATAAQTDGSFRTVRATLILVDERGRWWLLSASTTN